MGEHKGHCWQSVCTGQRVHAQASVPRRAAVCSPKSLLDRSPGLEPPLRRLAYKVSSLCAACSIRAAKPKAGLQQAKGKQAVQAAPKPR